MGNYYSNHNAYCNSHLIKMLAIMNDYITILADNTANKFYKRHASRFNMIGLDIKAAMDEVYDIEDKKRFLTQYCVLIKEKLDEHNVNCTGSENCMYTKSYDVARFFAEQELRKLSNKVGDTFSGVSVHGIGNIINLGTIYGDITNNVSQLDNSGLHEISEAIETLASAVNENLTMQQGDKQDYLELLKLLSEEALKSEHDRLPQSAFKSILNGTLATLNTFASIATISEITLPKIATYFMSK